MARAVGPCAEPHSQSLKTDGPKAGRHLAPTTRPSNDHNTPSLAIDKKLAVQDGLFFVALAEESVVSTILAGYDGHRGWLYAVAVHPSHRKKGLVAHAERALIQCGCMKINLQIINGNESVAAFYESLGYEVEQRVSMGKRIPQNITVP